MKTLVKVYFLSRLCGGEGYAINGSQTVLFLSRLCGGKVNDAEREAAIRFLSRLCGGEVYLLNKLRLS